MAQDDGPTALETLLGEIDRHVRRYGDDAKRHKKCALALRMSSVALAAVITVLLGWTLDPAHDQWERLLKNLALLLGSIITVVGAYEAFFDPRTLWIRETVTLARLKDLQRDLQMSVADGRGDAADAAKLAEFKRRLDLILGDSLRHWMQIRGAPQLEPSRDKTAL